MSNILNNKAINEEMLNSFKLSMDSKAIPNLDELLLHINNLINFIERPKMVELQEKNKTEFERLVFAKYNSLLPMKIISLLVEKDRYEHLAKLLDMFDVLNDVKSGNKDIQEEYNKFSENLNEKYVYTLHGGKDNFEKKMKEK